MHESTLTSEVPVGHQQRLLAAAAAAAGGGHGDQGGEIVTTWQHD